MTYSPAERAEYVYAISGVTVLSNIEAVGLNEYGLVMKTRVNMYTVLLCCVVGNVIASLLELRTAHDKLVEPLLHAGAVVTL